MPAEGSPSLIQYVVPYLLIMGIFYFLVFRPQKNKQKEFQKLLANVKKNDEVVTTGGIHGTVVNVKEKTIVVRIDDHARMEIDREAIARVVSAQQAS